MRGALVAAITAGCLIVAYVVLALFVHLADAPVWVSTQINTLLLIVLSVVFLATGGWLVQERASRRVTAQLDRLHDRLDELERRADDRFELVRTSLVNVSARVGSGVYRAVAYVPAPAETTSDLSVVRDAGGIEPKVIDAARRISRRITEQ